MTSKRLLALGLGLAGLLFMAVAPVQAAGFLIYEHGTKAMGMAGAFTAQADDPSALFYNAGGIAFQTDKKRSFLLGGTYVRGEGGGFDGAPPFPGAGVKEETETLSEILPHLYWVERINDRMTFGLGIGAPFGLSVEWKNKDDFTGRFISTKSALTAIDVNPTFGWKASDNFGIGIGIIARFSDVELANHRLTPGGLPIPAGLEFAKAKLEGGMDSGYGFNIGFLHKYNNSFHWGLQYRSRLTVDYDGDLTLTQISTGNPLIDGVLANVIPFNQKIGGKTSIEFPDIASLGLGFATSASSWLEFDINWNGWSSFDQIQVEVDSPALPDIELTQDWSDAWQYRVGFRFNSSQRSQWRIGYIYDETPQPEYTVSPVLPDANRNDFTFGYGYMGDKFSVDLAIMYVKFDDRTVSESDVFYFGTYNQDAWLLGVSFGF
ncbi:MAG: outer membrane protein transport protein [Thermoanaerobaculia bacterium]